MRSIRRSGVTALTAAIALALGAVPVALTVPSIVGSGEGTTTVTPATLPTGYVGLGYLELATDPSISASAKLFPAVGAEPTATQTFAAANCTPLTTDGADLLNFLGEGKNNRNEIVERPVGLLKGGFGVQDKGTGTSCGRADSGASESLTLSLGDDAVGGLRPLVSSARLDLDLKGGARVTAIATGPEGSFQTVLQSGTGTDGNVQYCSAGSDSGPDSGANDNCTWTITPPAPGDGKAPLYYTSLKLVANTGSFALSGGSDYVTDPAGHRSQFELVAKVDGEPLNCTDKNTTVKRDASGTKPEVQVRRLATNADNEVCVAVPYTLTNDVEGTSSGARFLKPLDRQKYAQFVADFAWVGGFTSGTTTLPATTVDFETDSAAADVIIGWCPDPIYDGTITIGGVTVPKLVGIANPLTNPAVGDLDTGAGSLGGIQFACVGVQNTTVTVTPATGTQAKTTQLKTIEQIYILGDIVPRKF